MALSIVPQRGLGFLTNIVAALDQESLTYVSCCGNQAAFVSSTRPVHLFPTIRVKNAMIRRVTAIALHKRRKLLALCITQGHSPPAILVYSFAVLKGVWITTLVATLIWEEGEKTQSFAFATFSSDASTILATTKSCSSIAICFNWQSQTRLFLSHLKASVEKICFHPGDPLQLSTSGLEHMRLWRLMHQELKACAPVKYLPCTQTHFTDHEWHVSGVLVAGTNDGEIAIILRNKQHARFRGVHRAHIKAVVPLEHGFATLCAACGLCIFELGNESLVDIKLTGRVTIYGIQNVLSASTFPGPSVPAMLLLCTHAVAVLNIPQYLVMAPQLRRLSAEVLPLLRQEGNITSLSTATMKPLVASSSTTGNSIHVWDWNTSELVLRCAADTCFQRQRIVCLDIHPNGHELLAGLEHQVQLYSISHQLLCLLQEITTRGAIILRDGNAPLVSTASLSLLKYANGGHMFAAITGRLIQIFDSHSREHPGKAAILHVLEGHAEDVIDFSWGIEDQRLFTASEDGAIYEWSIGSLECRGKVLTKTRSSLRSGLNWGSIAMFSDGALVAAGTLQRTSASHEALLCVWPEDLERPSVDVSLKHFTVTTVLPVDPSTTLQGMLIIGTIEGSLLVGPWPLDSGRQLSDLEQIPLCDGPIELAFSRNSNMLCVAGSGCAILLCRLGKFLSPRDRETKTAHDGIILTEKSKYLSLADSVETLTRQLGHVMLDTARSKNETQPKFDALLRQELEKNAARVGALQATNDALHLELSKAKAARGFEMMEVRRNFDSRLREFESISEKKLAIQVAHYEKIRDENDKLRIDSRDQLERQTLALLTREDMQKTSEKILVGNYESRIKVLQQYVFLARHQALCLLQQQDKRGDIESLQAKEDAIFEISQLQLILKRSMNDKAVLNQQNEALKTNHHKYQDELTEYRRAYNLAQEKAGHAKAQRAEILRSLQNEAELRLKFEATVAAQGGKLDYLTRWTHMLSDQNKGLNEDLNLKSLKLLQVRKTNQHLDKVLEAAGQKNKRMNALLSHKMTELQRANRGLYICRSCIRSKEKGFDCVLDLIDAFLFQLRDPEIRPQRIVLAGLEEIRSAVVRLRQDTDARNETVRSSLDKRPVEGHRMITTTRRTARDESRLRGLRSDNLKLMEELNELRFDRQALRRKLHAGAAHHAL